MHITRFLFSWITSLLSKIISFFQGKNKETDNVETADHGAGVIKTTDEVEATYQVVTDKSSKITRAEIDEAYQMHKIFQIEKAQTERKQYEEKKIQIAQAKKAAQIEKGFRDMEADLV